MSSFFTEILRRAGGDAEELLRTSHAALCLLAPWLNEHGRNAAIRLGADASAMQGDADAPSSLADLVDRVAARAQVTRGRAAEVAGVVAAVLGEGEDGRGLLAQDCPPAIADLYTHHPPAIEEPRAPPHPAEQRGSDERRTLSSGRPGARQPLADARSTAQHGSVADVQPHGDSKLSSGATTLERAAKTLATAAPKGEPLP